MSYFYNWAVGSLIGSGPVQHGERFLSRSCICNECDTIDLPASRSAAGSTTSNLPRTQRIVSEKGLLSLSEVAGCGSGLQLLQHAY